MDNGSDNREPSGSNLLEEVQVKSEKLGSYKAAPKLVSSRANTLYQDTKNGDPKSRPTNGMLPRSDPPDMASPPRKRRKLNNTASSHILYQTYGQVLKMLTAENEEQPGDKTVAPNVKNEVEAGNENADA